MNEIILLKEGEIALKGLNKRNFEEAFIRNLRHRMKDCGEFEYRRDQSMIYCTPVGDADMDAAVLAASRTFGAAAICRAGITEKDVDKIAEDVCVYCAKELDRARTFKVACKRSDKHFPYKSPELSAEVGGRVLEKFPHLIVDLKEPDLTVHIEIRDINAYIHTGNRPAAGGIPVGTSGRGMLLLSGGIDSPVAGYMMAKRGVDISCIHFAAPPYTSDRARLKVERLCERLTPYTGDNAFYCVPFTKLQEALRDHCPEEYFTIIMRRMMIKIAQKIAKKNGMQCLITGESVGQVASQTMGAIVCTDAACEMPMFRPCIGMDKTEIIEVSRRIDTFDISIEPYEDCCTVFTPKHPKTRPELSAVLEAEAAYDFDTLVDEAVEGTEVKVIKRE
ncbi:MAG: tRNA 4-thiouridine(8) synthase ThiI [Oscillospiraceae bacterium]|nr:tRNA 4-thiouridine(8) synthase ThiI [Oscillospiraceae bacterium]